MKRQTSGALSSIQQRKSPTRSVSSNWQNLLSVLLIFTVVCGAPGASQAEPQKTTTASNNHLGYEAFTTDFFKRRQPELNFKASSKEAALAWQRKLRPRLATLVGAFPKQACPLNSRVFDTKQLTTRAADGRTVKYQRQTIIFSSRPKMDVIAYFLMPLADGAASANPLACIVCPTGHSMMPKNPSNLDELVGINSATGKPRSAKEGYQKDLALQCVENGYCALAVEQLAFGKRREPKDEKDNQVNACGIPSRIALLGGETLLGWRVYDLMRAIDYLSTRKEVDSKRIACMGVSHGGTISLYAAALDPRIKCAVISCVLNTFAEEMLGHYHCICIYVPQMHLVCDLPDVAGLIAPRFAFFESAAKDVDCPIKGARDAFKVVRRIYDVLGVPSHTEMTEFDKEHEFDGREAFRFLRKNL